MYYVYCIWSISYRNGDIPSTTVDNWDISYVPWSNYIGHMGYGHSISLQNPENKAIVTPYSWCYDPVWPSSNMLKVDHGTQLLLFTSCYIPLVSPTNVPFLPSIMSHLNPWWFIRIIPLQPLVNHPFSLLKYPQVRHTVDGSEILHHQSRWRCACMY